MTTFRFHGPSWFDRRGAGQDTIFPGVARSIYGVLPPWFPWAIAVALFAGVGAEVFAQSPPAGPVPFARYVPESAKLFVTIRRLGELDQALHQAHAWQLAPLLSGAPASEKGPFDLRAAVSSFLGPNSSIDVDELMQAEMGLIAGSWSDVGRPVWLVRIRDDRVLERWFPRRRRDDEKTTDRARFFRTTNRVVVCVRDGIAAMGRHLASDSLLREVVLLMSGRGSGALEQSTVYKELTAYLPASPLAVAYVVRGGDAAADAAELSPWWPTIDHAVLGLFEGEGRLDLAVRASLVASHSKPVLPPRVIERLVRFPQTTLFAAATTLDFERAPDTRAVRPLSTALARYLTFLAGSKGASASESGGWPRFGPHLVFAWGQDLSERGLTPQLAAMIECGDSAEARAFSRRVAERLIQLLCAIDPEGAPGTLAVQEEVHLGVPISHVPFKQLAAKSKLPSARLLGGVDPAWTVWNGWLIVAVSRDHLERIIDAQYGLVATLATVPDVQALRRRSGGQAVLSVVRPGLATNVLDEWLAAHKAGAPSLLDPAWWRGQRTRNRQKHPQLGIGMMTVQDAGVVTVARVYPKTPAEGRLQVRDRILGIDGQLLSLDSPNADLWRRWAKETEESKRTLRVLRDGKAIDVVLPRRADEPALATVLLNPADAVRELASLGRTLEFASFAVHVSDERHYSARLTLRFGSAPTAGAPTSP